MNKQKRYKIEDITALATHRDGRVFTYLVTVGKEEMPVSRDRFYRLLAELRDNGRFALRRVRSAGFGYCYEVDAVAQPVTQATAVPATDTADEEPEPVTTIIGAFDQSPGTPINGRVYQGMAYTIAFYTADPEEGGREVARTIWADDADGRDERFAELAADDDHDAWPADARYMVAEDYEQHRSALLGYDYGAGSVKARFNGYVPRGAYQFRG